MAIVRKTMFGFPVPQRPASVNTVRDVPLSQGLQLDTAWPLLPPGSSVSMSNFLPLDGRLLPRSRLSSYNTVRNLSSISGMAALYDITGFPVIWLSSLTQHGILLSTGSISRASFTSAFGLGVAGITSQLQWQYAQVYSANLNNNMLVAAGFGGSADTLLCLYGNPPFVSYLTSAPKASAVGIADNYIIAWNADGFANRAKWCVRGNPSNWTGEGSGYEDLLAMRGYGTAVRGLADGRIVLFTNLETWFGITATYPAQFQFAPLDPDIGCSAARTIAETEVGLMFLGTDNALRVLPTGGGRSQIVSMSLSRVLRDQVRAQTSAAWALYDQETKLYHLFLLDTAGTVRPVVYNVLTGAWSFSDYNSTPVCGTAIRVNQYAPNEGLFFGNSSGTVYSSSSLIAQENGSAVTAFWRSAPIGADLAGNYKQLTKVCVDYRATSKSTVTLKISQDGGNTYEATGRAVSLPLAPVSGRVESDVYIGGAFPALEIKSESTGFELHRLDVAMTLGGRK